LRIGIAILLTLPGCSSSEEHRALDWVVTSHRGKLGGYSALTDQGANSLVGHAVHLGTTTVSGNERCERPEFVERTVVAGPFMALEYQSTAGRLGVHETDSVTVVEVLCEGAPWSALGGKVIFTSTAVGYAPWERRFFVVRPKETG
jgi:hypothetical protein